MTHHTLPSQNTTYPDRSGPARVFFSSDTGKYHYPRHETPYLLVANFRHAGHYFLNNRPVTASDDHFYLLNAGDRLEITFREALPLESFLVLFDRSFFEEAAHFLCTPTGQLLEDPVTDPAQVLPIPSVPFPMNPEIQRQLYSLTTVSNGFPPTAHTEGMLHTEEILLNILAGFYPLLRDTRRRLKRVKAVKRSTREEIYRRLFLAKQFMRDNAAEELTLDKIAATACINKFHFLTLFRDLHQMTPHQYLIGLRMEKAYKQLELRRCTVMEACYTAGFKSPATFSHLFKKKFGFPPSHLLK